jgi:hypothetical protein
MYPFGISLHRLPGQPVTVPRFETRTSLAQNGGTYLAKLTLRDKTKGCCYGPDMYHTWGRKKILKPLYRILNESGNYQRQEWNEILRRGILRKSAADLEKDQDHYGNKNPILLPECCYCYHRPPYHNAASTINHGAQLPKPHIVTILINLAIMFLQE